MTFPSSANLTRTSLQLYRDCLRLIRHIAPGQHSGKSQALRRTLRDQFEKRRHETDVHRIEHYKLDAVRALSNYLVATAAPKDPKLAQAMKDFHQRSIPKSSPKSPPTPAKQDT